MDPHVKPKGESGSLKDKWQGTFRGQQGKADTCACEEYPEELPSHILQSRWQF